MSALLSPVLVAVFPRFTEATRVVCDLLISNHMDGFAIGLAETDEQMRLFRAGWPDAGAFPLLLLRCTEFDSVAIGIAAVNELVHRSPPRHAAVLIADGPEAHGFQREGRAQWNREFAREISATVLDVQVFEYSPTWATSPPRIR